MCRRYYFTGDIAFRCVKYVRATTGSSRTNVTVCDINDDMLTVGKRRAEHQGMVLDWVCGSADNLPFPDQSFNAYTIAFGIRNCTDINQVFTVCTYACYLLQHLHCFSYCSNNFSICIVLVIVQMESLVSFVVKQTLWVRELSRVE